MEELTRIRHELHTVTHHAHLVQTRLPVEEHVAVQTSQSSFRLLSSTPDSLSVLQMPLHDPPILQERVCSLVVAKVNTLAGVLHHIASARICCRSIADELLEVCDVVRGDYADSLVRQGSQMRLLRTTLGVGQVHGYALWNANLIELQIWVTGDDSTGREVDTFPHQVPTQTTFLAFQARTNGLDWSAGLLQSLWNTSDVIVHIGCDMELQACVFRNDLVIGLRVVDIPVGAARTH